MTMSRDYNIAIIILSVMFGILCGAVKYSLWWGVGVTIGCYIVFFFGYWFGVMLDGIDNGLKELRNKKN